MPKLWDCEPNDDDCFQLKVSSLSNQLITTMCNNQWNFHRPLLAIFNWWLHRNLRTRRKMHLCMQDNQIGPKIMGLAPADVAIPHPSIMPIVVHKQPRLSAGTTYTFFELALLHKGNRHFLLVHSPSSS
jgi:hypothetical protein